jgi:DNA replication protein DnaC
MGMSS